MSAMGGGTSGAGARLRFSTLPGPLSGGPARNVIKRAPVVHSTGLQSYWCSGAEGTWGSRVCRGTLHEDVKICLLG